MLAQIDDRDYRSRLEAAEAQLTQATSELQRPKSLERGALPRRPLINARLPQQQLGRVATKLPKLWKTAPSAHLRWPGGACLG